MNPHDLLDTIGSIDPKYIAAADKPATKKNLVHIERYWLAAASVLILLSSGVLIRNNLMRQSSGDTAETMAVTATLTSAPVDEMEADAPEEAYDDTSGEDSAIFSVTGTEDKESDIADYPALIMVNGMLYQDTYEIYEGAIDTESALTVSSYTDEKPDVDGAQNFDRTCTITYVILDEDRLAVQMNPEDDSWTLFKKLE